MNKIKQEKKIQMEVKETSTGEQVSNKPRMDGYLPEEELGKEIKEAKQEIVDGNVMDIKEAFDQADSLDDIDLTKYPQNNGEEDRSVTLAERLRAKTRVKDTDENQIEQLNALLFNYADNGMYEVRVNVLLREDVVKFFKKEGISISYKTDQESGDKITIFNWR